MEGMFNGVKLSTFNYNSLLIGWSQQDFKAMLFLMPVRATIRKVLPQKHAKAL
jgi:hypothetical protein